MKDILGLLSYYKKPRTQAEELPDVKVEERRGESLVDRGHVVSLGPWKKNLRTYWSEEQLGAIAGGKAITEEIRENGIFLLQAPLVFFAFRAMRSTDMAPECSLAHI